MLNLRDFATSADFDADGRMLADGPWERLIDRLKRAALARQEVRDASGVVTNTLYRGLDAVEIPKLFYDWKVPNHSLGGLVGLHVEGEGRLAARFRSLTPGPIFHSGRGGRVTFRGIHAEGVMGEGQSFIQVHQMKGDTGEGEAAFSYDFRDMEAKNFHNAFLYTGNQMTDRMKFDNVRWIDNFNDIRMSNSQHVNSKLIGCESLYGVNGNLAALQAKLNTWSFSPHVYEGAMFRVRRGGDYSIDNCSIIGNRTTLLFEEPAADAYEDFNQNVLGWTFEGNTTWEFLNQDTQGDPWGQERITMLRSLNPYPDAALRVQPWVRVNDCRVTVHPASLDLAHVTNGMFLSLSRTRIIGSTRAKIISMVNENTTGQQGAYKNDSSSRPAVERRVKPGVVTSGNHKCEVSGIIPAGVL